MRVLVADDDRRVRLALRLFLEERGLVVVGEAASAQEIRPLVQGLRPDLLLLDWELPGLPEEGTAESPLWAGIRRVVALSSRPIGAMGKSDPLASPIEFVCKTDPPDFLIAALSPSRVLPGAGFASADAATGAESVVPDLGPYSGADLIPPTRGS